LDGLHHTLDACTDGFQDLDGLVLVYDVGDRSTFAALPEIFRRVKELAGKAPFPIAVVGNKVDLFQQAREVDPDEGTALAEAMGGIFGLCSAREGDKVREIVQQIMKNAVSARLQSLEEKELLSLRERDLRLQGSEQGDMSKRAKFRRSISQRLVSSFSMSNG
jgi:GTPase SAR1 family protein